MSELTRNPKPEIRNPIIVALDVSTKEEAREIVAELREEVGAFKIGLQLFTAHGAGFVRELTEMGAKIFLDLKFHDIPNTVANAAIEATNLGVWMFNVHALGGREMLERTVDLVRETVVKQNIAQPKLIAVTVLTSSTAETLREIGIENEVLPQVLKLAKLTNDCGFDGVVASPRETKAIRENIENQNFLIVTPGIRVQSPKSKVQSPVVEAETSNVESQFSESEIQNLKSEIAADDQKRTLSASEAVENGANFIVVGRPILLAENRIKAVREILSEIKNRQR
ncbi:MAG: orotidine-5'-phosphate decarboxylase [Pyrinomonadaceae bacterium]|nr:orotidine-5'-phosphate decarboxylase [Pyrinomonadaceae bacterium]